MTGNLWWQDPSLRDGLLVALALANDARRDNDRRPGYELSACSEYFRALNQLANSLDRTLPPPPPDLNRPRQSVRRGEVSKHQALLEYLTTDDQDELLSHPAVAALAHFEPLVLDHGAEGMSQKLDGLTDAVVRAASQQHHEFSESWIRWNVRGSGTVRTLSKLIRAILVIRNNLQHGEKTPSGPDLQRRKRNQAVGRVILPILEEILDVVLARPSTRLAAYGTLRPGRPNTDVITVAGHWTDVTLRGRTHELSGFPAFEADVSGEHVPAELFTSKELPKIWPQLDGFEGSAYQRRLGLYERDGTIGVASVYEWAGEIG